MITLLGLTLLVSGLTLRRHCFVRKAGTSRFGERNWRRVRASLPPELRRDRRGLEPVRFA